MLTLLWIQGRYHKYDQAWAILHQKWMLTPYKLKLNHIYHIKSWIISIISTVESYLSYQQQRSLPAIPVSFMKSFYKTHLLLLYLRKLRDEEKTENDDEQPGCSICLILPDIYMADQVLPGVAVVPVHLADGGGGGHLLSDTAIPAAATPCADS